MGNKNLDIMRNLIINDRTLCASIQEVYMSKSNISKNKMGKSLTYEEIGTVMELSPQQVHKIEREAFNKMVRLLMNSTSSSIFDTILALSSYLGLDPEQAFKKLDEENLSTLSLHTKEVYGRTIAGVNIIENPLDTYFK